MTDAESITVLTWARNEQDIMPFFLRHYASFADRIIVWDNGSDDRTPDIVRAHPKAELRVWGTGGVFDEIDHTKVKQEEFKQTGPGWKIVVDTDEFVWAADGIRNVLNRCNQTGANMVRSVGFDMIAERMPKDDGFMQLTDLVKEGVYSPRYCKICIFRRSAEFTYEHGCHTCIGGSNARVTPKALHCVLHYKWLGRDRILDRTRWLKTVCPEDQLAMGLNVDITNMEKQAERWDEIWEAKQRVIP